MSVPADMRSLTFVLLRRRADAPDLPEDELERIQREHLDHLEDMRVRGALLVAGPLSDQEDDALRGLCIYKTSVEETRALAAADPAVRAGRLAADVMTWWFSASAVTFTNENGR